MARHRDGKKRPLAMDGPSVPVAKDGEKGPSRKFSAIHF
ncbi:hypothetical protein DOT_4050 [Desulfosporosinus sp. OT]|nr:hypothetical protein DOT_4050 [Desulfosporosinus sp. OT]